MEEKTITRKVTTAQLTGLFLAAVLAVTTGCSGGHAHVDRNQDGYCDEDGEPMNTSRSSYWGYNRWGWGSWGGTTADSDASTRSGGAHISSGVGGPHGGIGSSHSSGGG